jgi:hypothetical protein
MWRDVRDPVAQDRRHADRLAERRERAARGDRAGRGRLDAIDETRAVLDEVGAPRDLRGFVYEYGRPRLTTKPRNEYSPCTITETCSMLAMAFSR